MTHQSKRDADNSSRRSSKTTDSSRVIPTSRKSRKEKRPTPYPTLTRPMTKSEHFAPTPSLSFLKTDQTTPSIPYTAAEILRRSKSSKASSSSDTTTTFVRKKGRIPYVLVPSGYVIEGSLHHSPRKRKMSNSPPLAAPPIIVPEVKRGPSKQPRAPKLNSRRITDIGPIDEGSGDVVLPDLAQRAKEETQYWWEDTSAVTINAQITSAQKTTVVSTKIHMNRTTPMIMRLILIKPFLLQSTLAIII
jgi:hypothetical protein